MSNRHESWRQWKGRLRYPIIRSKGGAPKGIVVPIQLPIDEVSDGATVQPNSKTWLMAWRTSSRLGLAWTSASS
jgi:hypothetical protein